jgi:hypothetical protein
VPGDQPDRNVARTLGHHHAGHPLDLVAGPRRERLVVTLTWQDKSSNETGCYVERAPSGTTRATDPTCTATFRKKGKG